MMQNQEFPPSIGRLAAAGCRNPEQAQQNLERLAGSSQMALCRLILPLLLDRLANLPDPDMALNNLERFAEAVLDRGFLFALFRDSPKSLDLALTLFGSSQHLSDILIRYPQDFHWLLQPGLLRRTRSREELVEELNGLISRAKNQERAWAALRRFKMREILRIGLQDLLGNLDLVDVTQQLSLAADVALQRAHEICWGELVRRHGQPRCASPQGDKACGFAIIGMGKLGAEELNFSSDIDLLFIYEGEGETVGVAAPSGSLIGRVSNHEFFTRLGEGLIKAIGEVTPEGHVFRVDMRLPPEGRAGLLADMDVMHLTDSYRFLCNVQNRLRIVADLETSSLPKDASRLDRLASRLGYGSGAGSRPGDRFLSDYRRHAEQVRGIYEATFRGHSRGDSDTRCTGTRGK